MLAVITGASSGLGVVFARQLAARGYNLLLIARREDRLHSIAREIAEQYHVRADTLAADLTDDAALDAAATRIRDAADLGLLVNNAGFGTLGYFFRQTIKETLHQELIDGIKFRYNVNDTNGMQTTWDQVQILI